MNALDVLIERILANANPSNMFWLKDNAERAAAELAQLRADNASLERKGLLLCGQNGELLMDAHKLRNLLDKARKVIQAYAIMFAHDHDANYTGLNNSAIAWLEKYKETP